MSTYLVDSHCHLDRLDLTPWDGQLEGALENAKQHGIGHMLCVSISLEEYPTILDIARAHENVQVSVGVHPNETKCQDPTADELVALAQDPQVVAIGETGLDYFRSQGELRWQQQRFRHHIRAARECGKPLIVHMRDAAEDTVRIMQEEGAAEVGGVMHCFTGTWDVAARAIELNFHVSFSGIVTFKNAEALRAVAARLPAERLLVETDCPYLAPVPHRGKTNEPAFVRHVAQQVAQLRGLELTELARLTTDNFFGLFTGAQRVRV